MKQRQLMQRVRHDPITARSPPEWKVAASAEELRRRASGTAPAAAADSTPAAADSPPSNTDRFNIIINYLNANGTLTDIQRILSVSSQDTIATVKDKINIPGVGINSSNGNKVAEGLVFASQPYREDMVLTYPLADNVRLQDYSITQGSRVYLGFKTHRGVGAAADTPAPSTYADSPPAAAGGGYKRRRTKKSKLSKKRKLSRKRKLSKKRKSLKKTRRRRRR